MLYVGIDLAWGRRNPSGVAALGPDGKVLEAGLLGPGEAAGWLRGLGSDVLAFVDAPLVVANPTGQRACETAIGRCYGRWKVSAHSSNLGRTDLAGVELVAEASTHGYRVHDGLDGPPEGGRWLAESFPHTTLVGVAELGFDTERPLYKRRPRAIPTMAEFRPVRSRAFASIVAALSGLTDPPLELGSHQRTRRWLDQQVPEQDGLYKAEEDVLDAVICAWTAALWHAHPGRCQVLGGDEPWEPAATVIAPARPEQRTRRPHGGI